MIRAHKIFNNNDIWASCKKSLLFTRHFAATIKETIFIYIFNINILIYSLIEHLLLGINILRLRL